MKKARKLGLQSLALVLLAFVLVAGVAFGMTGAWFVEGIKKDSAELTFDAIALTVTNDSVHTYRHGETTNATDAAVMPGDDVVIKLTINNAESQDFWYMVFVTVSGDGMLAADKTAFQNALTDTEAKSLTANTSAEEITRTQQLAGASYGNSFEGKKFIVTYEVRAIQKANIDQAEATRALGVTTTGGFTYTEAGETVKTYTWSGTGEFAIPAAPSQGN